MIDIYKWGKENEVRPGVKAIVASAMPDLKNSAKFLISKNIKVMVEIGTCYGLSAAHFAQYVGELHTFDVADFQGRQKMWDDLGVADNIYFYLINGRPEKNGNIKNHLGIVPKNPKAIDIKTVLGKLNYDFAFIDARHNYEDVKLDFELVKSCGRVLFHDTNKLRFEGVNKFVNEIGAKKLYYNVSYWEEK